MTDNAPTSELVQELRKLHQSAGRPPFTVVAGWCEVCPETIGSLFAGRHVTAWRTVHKVVAFLGGDSESFYRLWRATRHTARQVKPSGKPKAPQAYVPRKPVPGTPLTETEREVLHWISHGRTNEWIARKMVRSEDTIKSAIKRIYARLGANGRTHAVRLGFVLRYLGPSNGTERAWRTPHDRLVR